MTTDLHFWKFAFDIIQTVIMVGISIYVWITTKHKVNADKIAQLEEAHNKELSSVKNRLTEIDTTIKNMPARDQISRIHRRIDELSQSVHSMNGEMKGLTDNSRLILDTLVAKEKQ